MGNDHGKLAGNPGEEHIRFRGGMVTAPSSGGTHIYFKVVDGAFYDRPYFIEGIPFVRIALDAGKHAEFHVVISISGTSFFGSAAWLFTAAYPLPVYHVDLRTYPFFPVRASLFVAVPGIFHGKGAVFWAGGIAVNVVADFFKGTLISWIIRDQGSGKVEYILKEAVSFNRIKSGIPEESIRSEIRVQGKEIREYRLQGRRITDRLILVGGISFLFNRHLRVGIFEVIVEKSNVPDNAKPVGEDGKFVSITEMPVDIELFGIRAGSSL